MKVGEYAELTGVDKDDDSELWWGRYVCKHCGSDEITSDASAEWSPARQCWELSSCHDVDYCQVCESETRCKHVYDIQEDLFNESSQQ